MTDSVDFYGLTVLSYVTLASPSCPLAVSLLASGKLGFFNIYHTWIGRLAALGSAKASRSVALRKGLGSQAKGMETGGS